MAECFCGCGRRVKFSDRPVNTAGRTIETVLERLEVGQRNLPEQTGKPLSGEMEGTFLEYTDEGKGLAQRCLATLHDGEAWGQAETRAVREWRKRANAFAQFTSLPLDQMQRAARRG